MKKVVRTYVDTYSLKHFFGTFSFRYENTNVTLDKTIYVHRHLQKLISFQKFPSNTKKTAYNKELLFCVL